MKHTLTRTPVLSFLLASLMGVVSLMMLHEGRISFLTEETASSTVPLIETGETSTTTEPLATTTPDILTPELASSTASSTATTTEPMSTTPAEPTIEQSTDESIEFQDFYPRSPEDCRTPESLAFFRHPGECMRALRGGF